MLLLKTQAPLIYVLLRTLFQTVTGSLCLALVLGAVCISYYLYQYTRE